jgi:hypothetical protein
MATGREETIFILWPLFYKLFEKVVYRREVLSREAL